MALFPFQKKAQQPYDVASTATTVAKFLDDFSIEVMPRTADKISSFKGLLPPASRIYLAHIEGTPFPAMLATARRIAAQGFQVMPHFPARMVQDKKQLAQWIKQYQGEANVKQALLLAGGPKHAAGDFENSMQLIETGLFAEFERLHFAGHPEGNRDISPDGSDQMLMQALQWKQAFNERTDAQVALTTQFCFDSTALINWAERLADEAIELPLHIGVAGPAKIHTLIKYAIACGVGPSMKVLQRRTKDVTKLLLPYQPTELLRELAEHKVNSPHSAIKQVHFFPLGGIQKNADWACEAQSHR